MAIVPDSAAGRDDSGGTRPLRSRPATSAPTTEPAAGDVPVRAEGVQLIGEMKGSGYREPPALARRSDGQTLQLTPLLYLVLSAVDGRRSHAEIASRVSAAYGRTVTAGNVRTLIDDQLRATGLLANPDGSQPEVRRSNPLLALRLKYAVSDPERTRRLTGPFARLFHPFIVLAVLAAFLGVCWWVFLEKGLASATYEAFAHPGLLLLVVAVTVLSAGFHEFGHAAAARRGGATPGVMGAGVYLVWPAFYTDVTDSYRLGRGGRLRTDLGGLYFNAIVAVAVAGAWWLSGYDALLLVVATQILQMVRQLTPLVRFDGYHVLADLTGVPDLFQRIRPTLLGLLPWRWKHPETRVLKRWARAVVTLWVLVVVPVLAFSLFCMVVTLPRIVGTARASVGQQSTLLARAWAETDLLEVVARAIAIVAVTFPILAIGYILVRVVRRIVTSAWTRTRGRPARRALAALVAASLVAGLAYAWWPREGAYRPIQPYEGGTLRQAAGRVVGAVGSVGRPAPVGLVEGQQGRLVTGWSNDDPRPTPQHPQLALVLVPRGGDAASASGTADVANGGTGPTASGGTAQPWVFPFDKPLQPGPGDNQALAVNTTDNTITYDVAFALVWVEDDSPALNTNESYAFASCTNCAAVSVGFQVVLVTGDNHVAVPQNLSAAVNYDCVNCLTYALATQLFVTLDGPLSDAGMADLTALWQKIADFGRHIAEVPLSEIRSTLTSYEQQILDIIEKDQGPLAPAGPSPSAGPGSAGGTAGASASPSSTTLDTGSAAGVGDPGTADASTGPSSGLSSAPESGTVSGTASGTGEPVTGGAEPGSTAASSPSASPTSDPDPTPTAQPAPTAQASP